MAPLIGALINIFFDYRASKGRQNNKLEILLRRMDRIEQTHNTIINNFIVLLLNDKPVITPSEYQRLIFLRKEAESWRSTIRSDKKYVMQGNITIYTTKVKNLAMKTLTLCQKYKLGNGINSVKYDTKSKMLLINNKGVSYFG